MELIKTELEGISVLVPQVFGDNRGWFTESYTKKKLADLGINIEFVQDNHSFSAQKGTLRGLHFQNDPMAQTKLIRCTRGAILDVVVDIRKGSPTYKKWLGFELTAENHRQLLISKGFAHGFVTLTDNVEIQYKVDAYYDQASDRSIRFDDPEIGVDWNIENPVLSQKDLNAPFLKDSDCNFSY